MNISYICLCKPTYKYYSTLWCWQKKTMTRINADYSIDYSIVNTTMYYSIFILGLFCLCNCLALSVYQEKKRLVFL